MSQLIHHDIFQLIESWAPKSLAYDWDPIGLQVGSTNDKVKKVMVTLDVSEAVVDEAIDQGVNLIISHHPLLFKQLKQINVETSKGKIIQKLLTNGITVYSAHTNLDIATGGVNDILAEKLKLHSPEILIHTSSEQLFK